MRILLTGANGQVGRCLRAQKPEDWEMIAADSATLDITDSAAITGMVQNFEPDVIINAAGYTNLEASECHPDEVFAVNATGVRNLARAAANAGIRLIHISSDYVFDGAKHEPYTESDYPNPLSIYAKSKLSGELLALAHHADSIIVRSSWVFSEYGGNFVKAIVDQAGQERIDVVSDKTGCPTYAGDLARLMINLAQEPAALRGIYHYCGDTAVNRFQFAQTVLQELALLQPVNARLHEIPAGFERTPRPPYSVLNCEKIRRLGYSQPDWQAALKRILPQILAQAA